MADQTTTEAATVCGECRDMQRNRPFALRALGHDTCKQAIRAEQQAARRFGIRIDPDGCTVGSTYAGQHDTADKIHESFTPDAADRHRERGEGWRHEVITHEEWKRRAEPCLTGRCDHHP
jgi:hypothetical protein